MKIGQLENKAAVSPALGERKPGAANGKTTAAPGAEPSAKVELSSTLASLSDGHTDGVFDAAKVERISTAIREGKFTINAEAIADKLIVNAEELLGSAKR